jgi:hypothetical protein
MGTNGTGAACCGQPTSLGRLPRLSRATRIEADRRSLSPAEDAPGTHFRPIAELPVAGSEVVDLLPV